MDVPAEEKKTYARFVTEMRVRPDDLDLYCHVHASRYLDYVLAARLDQMERFYGMPMEEFAARGLGWFQRAMTINYKRPLAMGERFKVETGVVAFRRDGVVVSFKIFKENGRVSADGEGDYALIDMKTRRATAIPADVKEKYSL